MEQVDLDEEFHKRLSLEQRWQTGMIDWHEYNELRSSCKITNEEYFRRLQNK